MKRSYMITISPALVAPNLCWRWAVECETRTDDPCDPEHVRSDDLGSGLARYVGDAGHAAVDVANHAESAYRDGEDVT